MENDVKQRTQRNRRRERAQRMLAQKRENKVKNGADSGEDESPTREKPQRPPPPSRRKKTKDPAGEEDVIDGFAIMSFKSYDDLESTVRLCAKNGCKVTTLGLEEEPAVPKPEPLANNTHPRTTNNNNSNTNNNNTALNNHALNNHALNNHVDKGPSQPEVAGASDDNVRARERLAPTRAPSHDRLSDASSRCSSGRGYICDSEGDDDKNPLKDLVRPLYFSRTDPVGAKPIQKESRWKGSDGGSILFSPSVRKHDLPHLPASHHLPVLNNGTAGKGSPGRGSPSPPPPAKTTVMAPPSSTAPLSPARRTTPPPPVVQPLPPPAAAPTIPHYSISNGPLVGHPSHNSHSKLPTPSPPTRPSHTHSPRTTPVIVSSAYQPPPATYAPPPVSNPAYMSPHPVTASYVPPPTSLYQPALCTTGLSVSSNSNPVVVAAPSSYAQPPLSHATPYPPLYAPYSNTPYLTPVSHPSRVNRSPLPVIASKPATTVVTTSASPVVTTTTTSHRDIVSTPLVGRTHSPRGHSPTRERDSYSSNVSSLSRGSVTPVSCSAAPANPSPFSAPAPAPAPSSLAYSKPPVWLPGSSSTQLSPATGVPRHPLSHPSHPHPYPPPIFAPPVASAPSAAVTANAAPQPNNPHPFSAESLFQSSMSMQHGDLYKDQADLLRRELDNRFLASQDRPLIPPPYLRTEMHHHQHQHTHVHQHTTPMMPPPPSNIFAPPLFKDIPKLGGVDSPFYRQNLGMASYPGFNSGLLHPTMGGATPFAPPNHLPTFTPKQLTDNTKPKPVNLRTPISHQPHKMSVNLLSKTGKWNAMHVRIAWEIYHHQQKQATEAKVVGGSVGPPKTDLLRPPTHLFPPRPHDMSHFAAPHRAPHPFDTSPHPASAPFPSLGGMFGRYPPGPTVQSLPSFPHNPAMYDPWSRLQQTRATPSFPPGMGPGVGPWSMKPEPGLTEAEREREREREREKERERSRERDRQKREEKHRRMLVAQQQQAKQVRDRSPHREQVPQVPTVVPKEEEVVLLGRPPPPHHYLQRHPPRTLPPHFPPNPWDNPYRFDPLRYNPIMAAFREEEERKLFASYPPPPHMRAKAPSPHRQGPPIPAHMTMPHTLPHPDHKKEESSQSR